MKNYSYPHLNQLAYDLDQLQTLRNFAKFMMIPGFIWIAYWLALIIYEAPMRSPFYATGLCIGGLLVISVVLILFNFSKLSVTKIELTELLKQVKQQAEILQMTEACLAIALRSETQKIRSSIVDFLIEKCLHEIETDSSAHVRNFVMRQPELVQGMIGMRCQEML